MNMKLGYAENSAQNPVSFWPVYICFLVFGLLIPFSKSQPQWLSFVLSVLLSLIIGILAVKILIALFNSGNPALRQESNGQFAQEAVSTGMLFMIPFTVLAALAQLVLGWDAVMPFASAAIMTAAATAGTEVMKRGAQGIKNVMIPSVLAFVLSTGWMMLVGLLP